jgi:hypothetical protein
MIMQKSDFMGLRIIALLFEFYYYCDRESKKNNSDEIFKFIDTSPFFSSRKAITYYLPLVRRFLDKDLKWYDGEVDIKLTEKQQDDVWLVLISCFFVEIRPFGDDTFVVGLSKEGNCSHIVVVLSFMTDVAKSTFKIQYQDLVDLNYNYNKLFKHYRQKIRQDIIKMIREAITQIK